MTGAGMKNVNVVHVLCLALRFPQKLWPRKQIVYRHLVMARKKD